METTKLISDGMGDLVSVGPDIPAPFSLACCLRSFPQFALDMMRDKEFAHRLLTFCTDLTVECIKTCAEFGADVITIPDAWAVFPNISEELYFEFVHPYGTEVIKKSPKFPGGICWLAKEVGIARYTKDPYQFYDKLMESGTALLPVYAPDNATLDLAQLKAIAKKHGKSMSAMVHYNTVKYGPFDKIRKETVDLIRRGAPGNGFGIGINAVESDTPPENVDFYVELVKKEGKYPIDV
jgi:uroporphyrinogen-III decarboxylase